MILTASKQLLFVDDKENPIRIGEKSLKGLKKLNIDP